MGFSYCCQAHGQANRALTVDNGNTGPQLRVPQSVIMICTLYVLVREGALLPNHSQHDEPTPRSRHTVCRIVGASDARRHRVPQFITLPDQMFEQLNAEEREVLLDVGQFALDLIGIVEPTPFADVTSGVISIGRGNWFAAAVSSLAIIPYVGDLAKVARLPACLASVRRAIDLAGRSERMRTALAPVLASLLPVLSRLPLASLPVAARNAVVELDVTIRRFVPVTLWARSSLDELTERLLKAAMGSSQNVGFLPRQNMRVIADFLERHQYATDLTPKLVSKIRGMDLHAVEAITTKWLRAGDEVWMYIDTRHASHSALQVGEWMIVPQRGASLHNVGIAQGSRELVRMRIKQDREVLVSRAASTVDSWTLGREGTVRRYERIGPGKGEIVSRAGEFVHGSGEQLFMPRATRELFELLPNP
jgi:hypothetical protein